MTHAEATLALIADLYSQIAALQARNAELEAKVQEASKQAPGP